MLSTNLRTHYIILQDGRQFPITQSQYSWIRQDKATCKATEAFVLLDADTKKTLFDGEYRAIKEFREISHWDSTAKYFCDYGNSHGIHNNCDCRKKYGWLWANVFRAKAYNLYGKFEMIDKIIWAEEVKVKQYHQMYMQDLSYTERNNIVELCK